MYAASLLSSTGVLFFSPRLSVHIHRFIQQASYKYARWAPIRSYVPGDGRAKLGLGLGQTSGEMLFCLIIAACVEFLPRSLTHHLHPFVVTCDFRYVAICVCVSHKYFFLSLFMYICIHVHADKLCV